MPVIEKGRHVRCDSQQSILSSEPQHVSGAILNLAKFSKGVDQWPLTLCGIDTRLDSKKKHTSGLWDRPRKNNQWQAMLPQIKCQNADQRYANSVVVMVWVIQMSETKWWDTTRFQSNKKTSKWCVTLCFGHPNPRYTRKQKKCSTDISTAASVLWCCCRGTRRSGSMKNLSCGSCCLMRRTTVRGCLVASSVLLLLLLNCFPFFCFFLRKIFRVLSKRGSLSLFFCVHGGCVPGLNINSIDRVGTDQKKKKALRTHHSKVSSHSLEMRRPQPHPQMGAPKCRICCSSKLQLPDSPHCCMSGFSEGHTLAPLATLVVASCHNPFPLHWPVQGKKRPRSNTCNRHSRHIGCPRSPRTWKSHLSNLFSISKAARKFLHNSLTNTPPRSGFIRPIRFGPHPLRVHQKVLLATAVADTATSAPQVFHSCQGLFKRHEAYLTSTLLSVKSTHDSSKYSSRRSSPFTHLPQSCRTFTRRQLLAHVFKLAAHRLTIRCVRKQKKLADRGISPHLLTAIDSEVHPLHIATRELVGSFLWVPRSPVAVKQGCPPEPANPLQCQRWAPSFQSRAEDSERPLRLSSRTFCCGRPLDILSHHSAACLTSGVGHGEDLSSSRPLFAWVAKQVRGCPAASRTEAWTTVLTGTKMAAGWKSWWAIWRSNKPVA